MMFYLFWTSLSDKLNWDSIVLNCNHEISILILRKRTTTNLADFTISSVIGVPLSDYCTDRIAIGLDINYYTVFHWAVNIIVTIRELLRNSQIYLVAKCQMLIQFNISSRLNWLYFCSQKYLVLLKNKLLFLA